MEGDGGEEEAPSKIPSDKDRDGNGDPQWASSLGGSFEVGLVLGDGFVRMSLLSSTGNESKSIPCSCRKGGGLRGVSSRFPVGDRFYVVV